MSAVAEKVNARKVTVVTRAGMVRGVHMDPRALYDDEQSLVFRSLYPIGLEAFVQNPSVAMEKDIADHLFQAEHLLVLMSDGSFKFGGGEIGTPRPIGFCVWYTYNMPIGRAVYISGVCVNPSWQGKGLGKAMQQYAISYAQLQGEPVSYAFMSTQNAVEKKSFDDALGKESYPHTDGTVLEIGAEFAAIRGAKNYDAGTMRLVRHYGGASLYGMLPVCTDERYEQFFKGIAREEGDAYLCVAEV